VWLPRKRSEWREGAKEGGSRDVEKNRERGKNVEGAGRKKEGGVGKGEGEMERGYGHPHF